MIPELVEDGDIVLIDGPKDMDALNLLAKLSNQVRLGGPLSMMHTRGQYFANG